MFKKTNKLDEMLSSTQGGREQPVSAPSAGCKGPTTTLLLGRVGLSS